MPDRYSYSSPWSGGNQPWFRVGQIDVTTTVAVIGLGIVSMFVYAIEGPSRSITRQLVLQSDDFGGSVLGGQIWRILTWPVANEPDFWTIILFAVFYMLGTQLENLMGRKPFLNFLLLLTIVPAVLVTLIELITPGFTGFVFGLRFVELGVLVAFAAQYPTARFWPGIPAWGIAAGIVALDLLQALGNRNDYYLVLLFATVGVSLFAIRGFGYATELHWLPKMPLPAAITGETQAVQPRGATPKGRRRGRKRGNLSAVPTPSSAESPMDEREIDSLLDQVAERGLDSLTKDQRKRLEEHSKRLRKRRGE